MHTPISNHDRPERARLADTIAFSSSIADADPTTAKSTVRKGGRAASDRRRPSAQNGKEKTERRRLVDSGRKSFIGRLAARVVKHQIGLSLSILLSIAAIHACFPRWRGLLRQFYAISYYDETNGRYGAGLGDTLFIFFWAVVITFLRAVALDYVFTPLAKRGGVTTKKGLIRFGEQAWLMVYYFLSWPMGMYIMYNSPHWFDTKGFWTDWPVKELDGISKWYYLVQFAFWVQQIFVLNIEEKRKDFYQMYAHHIITCALMWPSYAYRMTRIGNAILCIMDAIDILLSAAKLLKYTGYTVACDYAFGVFMVAWLVFRHGVYIRILYSVYEDTAKLPFGCETQYSEYEQIFRTLTLMDDNLCWTQTTRWYFIILLTALQIITVVWFAMIVKVAVRVMRGGEADDIRSDDEDEVMDDCDGMSGTHHLKMDKAAETNGAPTGNGSALSSSSLPSVLMNGHSKARHISPQPLGNG